MNDPVAMQVGECAQQLHQQVDLDRESPALPRLDDVVRVLLEIHGEERHAIAVESVVEDADDVRMPERCEKPELLRQDEASGS